MRKRPIRSVCVIGLGYVGLPSAILMAEAGLQVLGVDIREDLIQDLSAGLIHLDEPDIEQHYRRAIEMGLTFSTQPRLADAFVIAVPTPVHRDNTANLDLLESAVASLIPYLREGNLIVIESTVPPTTTDSWMKSVLNQYGWNEVHLVDIAHCPERILPGRIMHELVHNARIIGGTTDRATLRAVSLYCLFVEGKLLTTSAINAEMTKLMENTYRDVNIALANELVKISSVLPIEPLEVIRLANYHPRVQILQPGPGVGGHCIAVDPYFIVEKAQLQTPLIQTARAINQSMPEFVLQQVMESVFGISNPKIAIFGLAYKGNVADVRESPAIQIVKTLALNYVQLALHDPRIRTDSLLYIEDLPLLSAHEAANNADLILILADHDEFRQLDKDTVMMMRRRTIIDTRNCVPASLLEFAEIKNFNNLFEENLTCLQSAVGT